MQGVEESGKACPISHWQPSISDCNKLCTDQQKAMPPYAKAGPLQNFMA